MRISRTSEKIGIALLAAQIAGGIGCAAQDKAIRATADETQENVSETIERGDEHNASPEDGPGHRALEAARRHLEEDAISETLRSAGYRISVVSFELMEYDEAMRARFVDFINSEEKPKKPLTIDDVVYVVKARVAMSGAGMPREAILAVALNGSFEVVAITE